LRANSSFAGTFGALGLASGGSGSGLSVPNGVWSIVLEAREESVPPYQSPLQQVVGRRETLAETDLIALPSLGRDL